MLHIILFEPEIPPNTGNIIRLCANAGAHLHLIHPLGFRLTEKNLQRAGLDYREFAVISEHINFAAYLEKFPSQRIFACSTKAQNNYADIKYNDGDAFLFGPESRGLPADMLNTWPAEQKIRIPMHAQSRSLNLSNAVAIILYEAWRQNSFK